MASADTIWGGPAPTALAGAPVPPLGHLDLMLFLLQIGVLLVVAYGLGKLARRVGLPPLVGELGAGVLLGPTVLGHAWPGAADALFPADQAQTHLLDAFTQFGVLLLIGITGAHFDTQILRKYGTTAVRVSVAGLLIPLACGVGAGLLVPDELLVAPDQRWAFAAFLGVALCVTALPVIAKTLTDLNLLHRDVGQLVVAAAFFDDAVGWLLLSLVSALAVGQIGSGPLLDTMLWLCLFLAVAHLLGKPIARGMEKLERKTSAGTSTTLTLAVALIVFYASATAAFGMEALFGAFVVGATVLRRLDPARLAPLRTIVMSVFAPVFLAAVGLRMDLTLLADPQVLVTACAVTAVAILGKFAGAYLGARTSRLSHWEGLALGAGMTSRGMIEVVIALAGLRLGVLTTATFTVIILVAIITSLTAPPMLRWAVRRIEVTDAERERERRLAGWNDPAPQAAAAAPQAAAPEQKATAPAKTAAPAPETAAPASVPETAAQAPAHRT